MSQPITIITGSRKGIGLALAQHYLSKGHIVLGCSRGPSSIEHPDYRHFSLDIRDEKSVLSFFGDVKREHSRVDNLINNAAIGGLNPSILTPTSQLVDILQTNFISAFLMSREAARIMRKNSRGRIVNFSSIMVPQSTPGHLAYVTSKAALESMTRVLAKEWGSMGITVNAIGPNAVETDLLLSMPNKIIEKSIAQQAVPGPTSMESLLHGVDFFLNDKDGRITGQVVYYGGAW